MDFVTYSAWSSIPESLQQGVDNLLLEAFPPDQRRSPAELHHLIESGQPTLVAAVDARGILGFVTVWDLDTTVFLEHFAVRSALRGHGLGSQILTFVREHWQKPVLLEVEPPDGPLEQRRIRFYQRNGYHLSTFPYRMPCLQGDGAPVPLRLMSCPQPLTDDDARKLTLRLYDEVYAGKPRPTLP